MDKHLKSTEQRYTCHGHNVVPIEGTLRRVPGGYAVDIQIDDPRCIITFATVNASNVIDRQGLPYRF